MSNINAEGLIVGRMASIAAKKLLNGENVIIVNAEKALMTGKKRMLVNDYVTKRNLQNKQNPEKSPKFPNPPNLFVRRQIRGMLPWKTARGRDAFRRLKIFVGNPEAVKDFEAMEDAKPKNLIKYMVIGDLCKQLGWRQ